MHAHQHEPSAADVPSGWLDDGKRKPTAAAASTALPPFFRISTPAADASASSQTTIACAPRTAVAGQLGCEASPASEYSRACGCCGCVCAAADIAEKLKNAMMARYFRGVRMANRIYAIREDASRKAKSRCSPNTGILEKAQSLRIPTLRPHARESSQPYSLRKVGPPRSAYLRKGCRG
jgi:hypothetical protein